MSVPTSHKPVTRSIQLTHREHVPTKSKYSLCLLAHDISLANNVGSLFRLADALGVEHLYLTGDTPVPPHPKIRKTSRAAEQYVAFTHHADPSHALRLLREQGYRILGLELTTNSIALSSLTIKASDKIVLIVGNENHGITPNLLACCEQTIHIPMLGQQSSMNLAVAAGIASYSITQKLQASPT